MRRYLPLYLISFFLVVTFFSAMEFLDGYAKKQPEEPTKNIRVYTNLPLEQVSLLAQEYEQLTSIRINVIPVGQEELIGKVQTDQADVILGTYEILTDAKQAQLLASVLSEQTDAIPQRFRDSDNTWVGLWYDPIVFAENKDFVKKTGQPVEGWRDLVKDSKVRISLTDFVASEASANLLYTFRQNLGESQTFAYFQKLHPQIVQYAKFLATPARLAGMNEVDVGIAMQSETLRYVNDGFPIQMIYPIEGTPYLLTGAGVVKQSTKSEEGKAFIDWLLQDHTQFLLQNHRYYFVPVNAETQLAKYYDSKHIKLYDLPSAITPEQEKILLNQWIQKVRLSPR